MSAAVPLVFTTESPSEVLCAVILTLNVYKFILYLSKPVSGPCAFSFHVGISTLQGFVDVEEKGV